MLLGLGVAAASAAYIWLNSPVSRGRLVVPPAHPKARAGMKREDIAVTSDPSSGRHWRAIPHGSGFIVECSDEHGHVFDMYAVERPEDCPDSDAQAVCQALIDRNITG